MIAPCVGCLRAPGGQPQSRSARARPPLGRRSPARAPTVQGTSSMSTTPTMTWPPSTVEADGPSRRPSSPRTARDRPSSSSGTPPSCRRRPVCAFPASRSRVRSPRTSRSIAWRCRRRGSCTAESRAWAARPSTPIHRCCPGPGPVRTPREQGPGDSVRGGGGRTGRVSEGFGRIDTIPGPQLPTGCPVLPYGVASLRSRRLPPLPVAGSNQSPRGPTKRSRQRCWRLPRYMVGATGFEPARSPPERVRGGPRVRGCGMPSGPRPPACPVHRATRERP